MLTSSKQEVFFSNLIKNNTCIYINWIYKEIKQINKEDKMKILLMLLGVAMAQVSLIVAFHTSHIIISILLLFLSIVMIFQGLPKYN